ncbi:hypothetical protein IXB28_05370 [Leptothoe kymatousa TAU-MAC 1615]|uniref:Arginine deiminase n=1 Tax=Leptothoe kymatousa TAU-MAC 1615 TaxID=2364775 RepID=A0ABS5Y1F9_9CYAN|nr:hypothetical protein [Leptothoe kymatousa TAU-MAC 1615]
MKRLIRDRLPAVDTARVLPHRKTPAGKTKVLHMNYMHSDTSKTTEIECLRFFAKTLAQLELRLEIVTDEGCREEIERELSQSVYQALDYGVVISQNPVSKWAEDSVEYLQNGQMAVLQPFDNELLEWAMTVGRKERWQGKMSPSLLEEILRDDHLWILLGVRVNELRTGLELERAARLQGQHVGHLRAYIEGGNMITGEDATGQPIILVGKDAIATTAHMYQLTPDEAKTVIAEDFGLDSIDRVIAVEQPGKFHLDMGMLFLGHGKVIVNDSKAALNDAVEMAEMVPSETMAKTATKLTLQCSLEDDAAQDLRLAGLEVRREKLENDVFYNFFNGEFVQGGDGLNYYITNGSFKDTQETFEALMVKELQVVEKVFFSPQPVAQKSLQERGGVGCRLKGSSL